MDLDREPLPFLQGERKEKLPDFGPPKPSDLWYNNRKVVAIPALCTQLCLFGIIWESPALDKPPIPSARRYGVILSPFGA